jgi:putative ABC transport system substrate-binding protein
VRVIGWLGSQSADDDHKYNIVAFLRGLKETGFVEGENVVVEYRYAKNRVDQLPALAADLVRRRVAVIVAGGNEVKRWSRLSEQFFRIDKWNVCRG